MVIGIRKSSNLFFVQSIFHYENCALLRPHQALLRHIGFFSSNTYGIDTSNPLQIL